MLSPSFGNHVAYVGKTTGNIPVFIFLISFLSYNFTSNYTNNPSFLRVYRPDWPNP
jgi:hypothetical protein